MPRQEAARGVLRRAAEELALQDATVAEVGLQRVLLPAMHSLPGAPGLRGAAQCRPLGHILVPQVQVPAVHGSGLQRTTAAEPQVSREIPARVEVREMRPRQRRATGYPAKKMRSPALGLRTDAVLGKLRYIRQPRCP